MGKELEIKLSVENQYSATAWQWLEQRPEARPESSKPLRNIYFDTPDGLLNHRRVALRVRQAGDRFIQTLKSQGEFVEGVHRRNEWEWSLADANLGMDLLVNHPVLEGLDTDTLQPVFETNFTRRTLLLEDKNSLIEVAFDSGEILAGGDRQPLSEIEFELKQGQPVELLRWAGAVSKVVPVFLNMVSKAEQGYHLAGVAGPMPKADGVVSVHGFLELLSACWLRRVPMPIGDSDLSEIETVAEAAGLKSDCQRLIAKLASGVLVNDLIDEGSLGKFQLAIAHNARA
ncbi:CYTH domain-containing protein [Marinobacter sp. CHS3-4]|uniref:CYTH domain-containing protein n=1 Tax=Marinobacter sp. CHS3-4 TaxID=3045174 RepID=UPI0024B48E28|nr:CYTH domain-containing protein [Marinobacter sp. CHS3-4]MDI9246689.1 CYTH domain-containing protein [Marinobacter sp. CHS3-4]